MSDVLDRIKSRGYWHVALRPDRFDANRLPFESLEHILDQSRVQIRGWDYPHFNANQPLLRGSDYIAQETDWEHHLELWRLYQSGQFVHFGGFHYDWSDRSSWWPEHQRIEPGTGLYIGDALYRFTEVFEFSSRLAKHVPGDDPITLTVEAHGLQGRKLLMDDPMRIYFPEGAVATVESHPQKWRLSRTELETTPRVLAVDAARQLFLRFGKNLPVNVLLEWQAKFRSYKGQQS